MCVLRERVEEACCLSKGRNGRKKRFGSEFLSSLLFLLSFFLSAYLSQVCICSIFLLLAPSTARGGMEDICMERG